jgi:hypothetical protein
MLHRAYLILIFSGTKRFLEAFITGFGKEPKEKLKVVVKRK